MTIPADLTWRHLVGAVALAGIDFTVSLFIAGLAFAEPALQDSAKLAILAGSVTGSMFGTLVLLRAPSSNERPRQCDRRR